MSSVSAPIMQHRGLTNIRLSWNILNGYTENNPFKRIDTNGNYSLNAEEEKILKKMTFWGKYKLLKCRKMAELASIGLGGQHNGLGDAIWHCVWSCCMTHKLGDSLSN